MLLLGRDHHAYGEYELRALRQGRAACALSVGGDRQSPGLRHKGDPAIPNEDAALLIEDRQRTLLAVADGHHGHYASHALLTALARPPVGIAATPLELVAQLAACTEDEAADEHSRTALAVAVWHRADGAGFGISYGDASMVLLRRAARPLQLNTKNSAWVSPRLAESLAPGRGAEFEFVAEPGDLVVGFSDGIDACCYRRPELSIGPAHVSGVFDRHPTASSFARALTELALAGVDNHPGGQDNIAVVAAG